jgi:hypothetical protein
MMSGMEVEDAPSAVQGAEAIDEDLYSRQVRLTLGSGGAGSCYVRSPRFAACDVKLPAQTESF